MMDLSTPSPDFWNYLGTVASPFDAAANPNPAASNAPVTTTAAGASTVSPSWLTQLTGLVTGAGQAAGAVLPSVNTLLGNTPTTTKPTTVVGQATAAANSFLTSSTGIIAVLAGVVLLVVLLIRRRP